jgi:hypothetical protein
VAALVEHVVHLPANNDVMARSVAGPALNSKYNKNEILSASAPTRSGFLRTIRGPLPHSSAVEN